MLYGPLRPRSRPFSQSTRPPGCCGHCPRQNPRRRPSVPPRCPICRERTPLRTRVAAANRLGLREIVEEVGGKVGEKIRYCATFLASRRVMAGKRVEFQQKLFGVQRHLPCITARDATLDAAVHHTVPVFNPLHHPPATLPHSLPNIPPLSGTRTAAFLLASKQLSKERCPAGCRCAVRDWRI